MEEVKKRPYNFKDLTGLVFERLTVLEFVGIDTSGRSRFKCQCSCPNNTIIETTGHLLRSKQTKSCGCLKAELARNRMTTHGKSHTLAHRRWKGMFTRCYNKNRINYKDYGGRGIKVCERWHNFEFFLTDMGNPPTPRHHLDRFPNNDGDYEPGNCRWVLQAENNQKKRNNRLLTFSGKTLSFAQWAIEVGLKRDCIKQRINSGWSTEKALTTPPYKKSWSTRRSLAKQSKETP